MPETVTIQLSDGQPFTATTQDRWIILPTGRLPHSSTVGELEWMMNAKINDDALVIPSEPMKKMGWCKTDLANAELNAQIDGGSPLWFAIRPTNDRSWSDIGLAEQPAPSAEDPRISALEAENRALRWAASRGIMAFCTDNEGNQTYREAGSEQWKPVDLLEQDHFLLARAAMERKP